MAEHISGLGSILNFTVTEQFIKWGKYIIALNSIAVFSTGISTRYKRKAKEKSGFGKAMGIFGAVMSTAFQVMDDENLSEQIDTLSAACNFYGSDENFPCINLSLSDGTTVEITFVDLLTFRDCAKAVEKAIANSAKPGCLEVHGTEIVVDRSDFYGDALFIEAGNMKEE